MLFKHGLSNYVGCVCGRLNDYFWFLLLNRGEKCSVLSHKCTDGCKSVPPAVSETFLLLGVHASGNSALGFQAPWWPWSRCTWCGWWSDGSFFRFKAGFLRVSHRCWVYAGGIMDLSSWGQYAVQAAFITQTSLRPLWTSDRPRVFV